MFTILSIVIAFNQPVIIPSTFMSLKLKLVCASEVMYFIPIKCFTLFVILCWSRNHIAPKFITHQKSHKNIFIKHAQRFISFTCKNEE